MKTSLSATHRLPIDPFPRVQAVCFDSFPQARFWLDDLINEEDITVEDNRLKLASGIVIESPHLTQILACKDKAGIEDRYISQNRQFRRGPWHEQPRADPTPKADRIPAAAKPEKPKRPETFVTVAQIAAQLKVKPFDVRQALRNSGAVKPEFGWAFAPDEVAAIKKLIGAKS